MESRQVGDIERVMYQALGGWDVDLVGIFVDVLEHFERDIPTRSKLGLSFIREAVFAKV